MGVSPWMNARWVTLRSLGEGGYASAGSAEVVKDATGVSPWRLHTLSLLSPPHQSVAYSLSLEGEAKWKGNLFGSEL